MCNILTNIKENRKKNFYKLSESSKLLEAWGYVWCKVTQKWIKTAVDVAMINNQSLNPQSNNQSSKPINNDNNNNDNDNDEYEQYCEEKIMEACFVYTMDKENQHVWLGNFLKKRFLWSPQSAQEKKESYMLLLSLMEGKVQKLTMVQYKAVYKFMGLRLPNGNDYRSDNCLKVLRKYLF